MLVDRWRYLLSVSFFSVGPGPCEHGVGYEVEKREPQVEANHLRSAQLQRLDAF